MTAVVTIIEMAQTKRAALTAIFRLDNFLKKLLKGRTWSREMAYVTRCADMKHDAVAHVESTQSMERIATAPFSPMVWTRYSAQLFAYVAEMIPSKSCMQNKINIRVGTDRSHAEKVER